MPNNLIKMYDEKGVPGVAVYMARKRGTKEWKLLYIWADYNRDTYTDFVSGEVMPKGYYMYMYLGSKIENRLCYDSNGPLAKIFLSEIVDALHEGGIRCSIDDFGVGYSSFRILKDLRMDELKLDRLFLAQGIDPKRDDKIITTITDLARDCGMSLVMEGVETKAMYDRVVQMGIGIIQGYYYAKAIPVEEFKIFVKSNTSIRYKAVVK